MLILNWVLWGNGERIIQQKKVKFFLFKIFNNKNFFILAEWVAHFPEPPSDRFIRLEGVYLKRNKMSFFLIKNFFF